MIEATDVGAQALAITQVPVANVTRPRPDPARGWLT